MQHLAAASDCRSSFENSRTTSFDVDTPPPRHDSLNEAFQSTGKAADIVGTLTGSRRLSSQSTGSATIPVRYPSVIAKM